MSSAAEPAPKSKRGGKRPGAGRKAKGYKSSSALPEIDLEAALAAPAPDDIESTAQAYSRGAIASLVKQLCHGKSATAAQDAYRRAMNRQLVSGFGNDPPLFWYSVRRSLAAATLAAGDAQTARAQLYASLRRWPNDALALYALSHADRAAGDAASADRNLARARGLWAGDVTRVPLARI